MSKELREMLQALEQMKAQVRAMLGEDKITEAEKKMEEVRALQKKVAMQIELEEAEKKQAAADSGSARGVPAGTDLESEYHRVFMRGFRRQAITADDLSIIAEYNRSLRAAVMHEGGVSTEPDGDSALIIPQDIQTQINEIMRTLNDLSPYVNEQVVNTLSGSRVLEKDADMTPFQVVEEYGEIQETDAPKFVPVTYQLVKRAGYLPITRELLADTDQNIMAYIANWIAKKHVVTKNGLILGVANGLTKRDLADVDAIKKVLNVDLDPAISLTSILLTNQDGFHWLDSQKDADGRDLLQDDITQPSGKLFKGRPVVVVSNRQLASTGTTTVKAPLIIGNLKELIALFTRGRYELATTTEGGDAWRRDTNELRTITRDDCKQWDDGAAVYGQLTISESGA